MEVANISAQQPNRLTIVDREVASTMYPFLKPVLLDGMPTGLVMCTSCQKFLRAEGVRRGSILSQVLHGVEGREAAAKGLLPQYRSTNYNNVPYMTQ